MRRTVLILVLALGISPALIRERILNAQQAPEPRVADLVRAGRVRVGLALLATFATKDPGTGELRGVAIDLARALAARLGVEILPVAYPGVARVLDGLKDGAWDVAFLAVDPARAALADFSHPYMQIDDTYLVSAGPSIRNVADADQPGVRIAVVRGASTALVLSRMLKRAELVHADTIGAALNLLRAGKVHALASPRAALLRLSAQLPGSRVLEDRFGTILYAMLVPKGHAGRLAYLSEFIEEAKASGLVERAIKRAGLRGVEVAPAENPSAR